jgi:hypothetical protein
VSESSFDYLTQEMVRYVLEESKTPSPLIVLEQVGFDIGYRLVERCIPARISSTAHFRISPTLTSACADTRGTSLRSRRSRIRTGGQGLG